MYAGLTDDLCEVALLEDDVEHQVVCLSPPVT